MALHVLLNKDIRSVNHTRANDEEGGLQLFLGEVVEDKPAKYEIINGLDPAFDTYGADKQRNTRQREEFVEEIRVDLL